MIWVWQCQNVEIIKSWAPFVTLLILKLPYTLSTTEQKEILGIL